MPLRRILKLFGVMVTALDFNRHMKLYHSESATEPSSEPLEHGDLMCHPPDNIIFMVLKNQSLQIKAPSNMHTYQMGWQIRKTHMMKWWIIPLDFSYIEIIYLDS